VTLFYGVLDEGEGTFVYGSAGHEPQLLRRAAAAARRALGLRGLDPTAPCWGALPASSTRSASVRLGPGDGCCYHDGLSEARSEEALPGPRGRRAPVERVPRLRAPSRSQTRCSKAARGVHRRPPPSDDTAVLWLEYTTAVGPSRRAQSPHRRPVWPSAAGHAFASSARLGSPREPPRPGVGPGSPSPARLKEIPVCQAGSAHATIGKPPP
jgi:hypothetical protein